jgi:hypothetical protein
VIDRVPRLQVAGAEAKERFRNIQLACRAHAHEHGIDDPAYADWHWPTGSLRSMTISTMMSLRPVKPGRPRENRR